MSQIKTVNNLNVVHTPLMVCCSLYLEKKIRNTEEDVVDMVRKV